MFNEKTRWTQALTHLSILDANEAVKDVLNKPNSWGKYSKFTPEQQANIAGYAVIHGITAAVRRFSGESDAGLKESTICP